MTRDVGNYRLLEELGEGAMGTVFRALDTNLDREVALKSLRPELARRPDIVERFREEARLQGRLESLHIVRLYQFLREGNEYFMVMEFVRGNTLAKMLSATTRLPAERAIEIVIQVLNGLGYAHKRNVVHRDVKPANIMISDENIVKVTDFGIARLLGSARMTKVGSIVGTLEYISPEAILGKDATALSDLYSTGVVLYELLSGRLPFNSESEFELVNAHVKNPPPSLRQWVTDISRPLEEVVMRSLAKNPADRFRTAEAMASALSACLQAAAGSDTRQDTGFLGMLRSFGGARSATNASEDSVGVLSPLPDSRRVSDFEDRRRAAVSMLNRRIDDLIGHGEWDQAQQEVDQSVRTYPGEPALLELTSRIARERGYYRDRLQMAVQEGRGLLDKGLPQLARSSLEAALARYKDDPELTELLHRADAELAACAARSSEVSDLASQASEMQKAGRYQDAVNTIIEAVGRLPHHPELTALLSQTVQSQKEYEKSCAVQNCRREVSALRRTGDWETAFGAIDKLLIRHPKEPALLELRQNVEKEREAQRRAKEVASILSRTADLEKEGHLEAAGQILAEAIAGIENEPLLLQRFAAIDAARKAALSRAAADEALDKAHALTKHLHWEAALNTLKSVACNAPDDQRLDEARRGIEQARDAYQAEIGAVRDDALQSMAQARFEDAFVTLSAAALRYPGETSIGELLLEAQTILGAERRERQLTEVVTQADELLSGNAFSDAEQLLLDAISRFPDEPRITGRLSSAIQGRRELEKVAAAELSVSRARQLADAGDLEDAIAELDSFLVKHGSLSDVDAVKREFSGRLQSRLRAAWIADLRQRISAEIKAARFDSALSLSAEALRKYPDDPEVTAIHADIGRQKIAAEHAMAAADLTKRRQLRALFFAEFRKQVGAELKAERFDAALSLVADALRKYPGDSEFSAIQADIEHEKAKASAAIAKHTQAAVHLVEIDVRALLSQQQWVQAEALLSDALREFPGEPILTSLLGELASAKLSEERTLGCIAAIQEALKAGKAALAEAMLLEALSQFPERAELLRLRITVCISVAREHLNARRLDSARRAVDEGIRKFGNDSGFQQLSAEIGEAERAKTAADEMIGKAAALADEGRVQAASQILDNLPEWAENSAIAAELRTRCMRLEAWQSGEFRRISTKAEDLLAGARYTEAVTLIEAAAKEKQLQLLLEPLLARALSMRQVSEAIARKVEEIRRVLAADGPAAALALIASSEAEGLNDPGLRSLRDHCERELAKPFISLAAQPPAPPMLAAQDKQPVLAAQDKQPTKKTRIVTWPSPADSAPELSAAPKKKRVALLVGALSAGVAVIAAVLLRGPSVPSAALRATPATLEWTLRNGAITLSPGTLSIAGSGQNFELKSKDSWLVADPEQGQAPATVTVSLAGKDLTPGSYSSELLLLQNGQPDAPQHIAVNLRIEAPLNTPSPEPPARLVGYPPRLSLDYQITKTLPPPQKITITASVGQIPFTARATTRGQNWLSVSPRTLTTPAALTVSFNLAGLSAGTYEGEIVCRAESGQTIVIPVDLTIRPHQF
jgi:serine/threonine protein kinase